MNATLQSTGRFMPHGMSIQQIFYCSLITNVHPNSRLLVVRQAQPVPLPDQPVPPQTLPSNSVAHVGVSPYPLIRQCILDHCKTMCPNGGQPVIHAWSMTKRDGKTWVMFDMRVNRYCANVDREHSQSNVGYVVDLKKGIFYQTCLSSKCKGFKSTSYLLPPEVWAIYK